MFFDGVLSLIIIIVFLAQSRVDFSILSFDEYLSVDNTKRLKGLMALAIVAHHILLHFEPERQYWGIGSHGYLIVSIFFFFNGYGLMYKVQNDKNYLDGYIRKRVVRIALPFLVAYFIYILWDVFEGKKYLIIDIFKSFFNGVPIVGNFWYILFILLFYIVFYVLARISNGNCRQIFLLSFIFFILWFAFCYVRKYAQVWTISILPIILGMGWCLYRVKIETVIKKFFSLIYIVSGILYIFLYYIAINNSFNYLRYFCCIVSALSFTVFLVMSGLVIHNYGKILLYFGSISFEIYLTHGLFVNMLRGKHIFIENKYIYTIAVFLLSIVSAHYIHKLVYFCSKK